MSSNSKKHDDIYSTKFLIDNYQCVMMVCNGRWIASVKTKNVPNDVITFPSDSDHVVFDDSRVIYKSKCFAVEVQFYYNSLERCWSTGISSSKIRSAFMSDENIKSTRKHMLQDLHTVVKWLKENNIQ